MNNENKNIYIVGTGNDPIMSLGKRLAMAAFFDGYDAKNTSVIALGVIGGTVVSQVRFGKKIISPLIEEHMVDYLVSFDYLETFRYIDNVRTGGYILTIDTFVQPTSVSGLIEENKYGVLEFPEHSEKKVACIRKKEIIEKQLYLDEVYCGMLSMTSSISGTALIKAREYILGTGDNKRKESFEYGQKIWM